MTLQIYNDRIDTLSFEEVNGAIRRLTRKCLVMGLEDEDRDYRVLKRAIDKAGVPVIGHKLTGQEYEQLVLVARKPKVMNDPTTVEVILDYEHILDGSNQNLSNPYPFGVIRGKTKCSVQQKPTNFFRRNPATALGISIAGLIGNPNIANPFLAGWGTGEKELITVRHTWPSNDQYGRGGKTETQGGEVNIYQPHRNLNCSGYYTTTAPWVLADFLIASINNGTWVNHPAGEWMCTEVAWEYQKRNQYRFEFEFQHNPDGWNPVAVFIDTKTQKPPAGLIEGRGYKTIPCHKPVNFNVAFNAFFEGWQQILSPLIGI